MTDSTLKIWLIILILLVSLLSLAVFLFVKFSLFLIQENRKSENLIEILKSKLRHSKQKESINS